MTVIPSQALLTLPRVRSRAPRFSTVTQAPSRATLFDRRLQPIERMSILELKAARNWSLAQTAKAFLVTSATISTWMRRLDEEGPDALVQMQQPVNRFPDFITYVVQKLKKLCPTMGKKKVAETLARAGFHLGTTTVCTDAQTEDGTSATRADDSQSNHGRPRRHGQVPGAFVACRI